MGRYNEDHYIFQVLQSSLLRKLSIENFPDQAAKAPHVCGTERKTNNKRFIRCIFQTLICETFNMSEQFYDLSPFKMGFAFFRFAHNV